MARYVLLRGVQLHAQRPTASQDHVLLEILGQVGIERIGNSVVKIPVLFLPSTNSVGRYLGRWIPYLLTYCQTETTYITLFQPLREHRLKQPQVKAPSSNGKLLLASTK